MLLLAWAGGLAGCGPGAPAAPAGKSLAVPVQVGSWRLASVPGQEILTDHYRIFTTVSDRSLLGRLPGFLERAREHYLELTGLSPLPAGAEPMPVYLLATRQQWATMTERVTGPLSRLYLSIENGGYHYRGVCVYWDPGPLATFSLAAHEGMHQFLHHRLRDGLPAAIEEGLATLTEGSVLTDSTVRFDPRHNVFRQTDLRRAVAGARLLPLRTLLTTDAADHVKGAPQVAAEYYGQLWAMLLFIRSDAAYRAGLQRMLADAAAGRLRRTLGIAPQAGAGRAYARSAAEPAFRHYIDGDLSRFETRYRAYARTLARLN